MTKSDALRWDQRYREESRQRYWGVRNFLLDQAAWLPESGRVIDVACGLGGNAGFLIERGLDVIGIDISPVAVRTAKERQPALKAVIADLEHYDLPEECCDVILNFYYLQRDLWPKYARWLKPGGLLLFETLTVGMLQVKPELDRRYLLLAGELRSAFADWEIIHYMEGPQTAQNGSQKHTASLAARRKLRPRI